MLGVQAVGKMLADLVAPTTGGLSSFALAVVMISLSCPSCDRVSLFGWGAGGCSRIIPTRISPIQ